MVQKSWKEFDHLKSIDVKYYAPDYYDVNVNKYGVKTEIKVGPIK